MIRGVGIDISDPQRFEDMGEAMLRRIFTEHEIDSAPRRRGEHFAARFAAKEAFAKALGTGIRGFSLTEIEVREDEAGRPYLSLSGRATLAREVHPAKALLLISTVVEGRVMAANAVQPANA